MPSSQSAVLRRTTKGSVRRRRRIGGRYQSAPCQCSGKRTRARHGPALVEGQRRSRVGWGVALEREGQLAEHLDQLGEGVGELGEEIRCPTWVRGIARRVGPSSAVFAESAPNRAPTLPTSVPVPWRPTLRSARACSRHQDQLFGELAADHRALEVRWVTRWRGGIHGSGRTRHAGTVGLATWHFRIGSVAGSAHRKPGGGTCSALRVGCARG